ncbi:hypothetical protein LTR78_006410 [Recurvomyces mirabilis]|uniref:Uncharacterized protein n=1 Tax=Recurvomyces mirabilis TaxID=574656 RepID=A0AAE0WLF0_9PEZI|nr:hypothetical protein LTR78_006410 [Recurvomyces mirabilis]KAK5152297.1 hypothetical protein LTS14_008674 [Recurvomyces mirabilis]
MAAVPPHHIKCCLDLGTWKCTWAYVLCQEDGTHIGSPQMLRIEGMGHEIRGTGTWLEDGRFVFGNELLAMENENPQIKSRITSFFKLGLYKSGGTKGWRERLEEQLKMFEPRKTLSDFYEAAFRALMATFDREMVQNAKSYFTAAYGADLIAGLPRKVYVSRPQVFDLEARRTMMQAAKQAGLEFVFLASEPHNVLAHLVDSMVKKLCEIRAQLGDGTTISIVDAGSGTVDLVLYECKGLTAHSQVDAEREEAGVGCGSAEVDELVFEEVLDDLLNLKGMAFEDMAMVLGQEPRVVRRTVFDSIERCKKEFPTRTKQSIAIDGAPGCDDWVIKLEKRHFTRAFDFVIGQIMLVIDKITRETQKVNLMEVTGGLATNAYFMDALRQRYEPGMEVVSPNQDHQQCHSVALGALYRHPNIEMCTLPTSHGYAAIRNEVFDYYEKHQDTCWYDKSGELQYDEDSGFSTPGGMDQVYDRLFTLIPKGANLGQLRESPVVWEMLINDVDYKKRWSAPNSYYWIADSWTVRVAEKLMETSPMASSHGPPSTYALTLTS